MKKLVLLLFVLVYVNTYSQSCMILSKANNITPDRLCSPVSVIWEIQYTGVDNAGTPVTILYEWNDGTQQTVAATQSAPGVFSASLTHTYISQAGVCNYHPRATMLVNGVLCTSSTQEQIVTVWDNDDNNGGDMRINPVVWPICFGNGDNASFQDVTQFNCVPPQERDNPNVNTRWVQWIYGTDITMSGTDVTINGVNRTFPFTDNVITLTGPVTGSGVWSDIMNVANDKQIGEYFEITLRNWNFCNPYDDPNIPGPPLDSVNGDHPPVITTARILIVDYPDATIHPVDSLCESDLPITLTSVTPGGLWTGIGVFGNMFNPSIIGRGTYTIYHDVTNLDGCSDTDSVLIHVKPVPNAIINPIGIVCETDSPFVLTAVDTGGVWSGIGVSGNIFSPQIAGMGSHLITYDIQLDGCINYDRTTIIVAIPNATINPVDTLCENDPPILLTAHDMGGVWMGNGISENIFYPTIAGVGDHLIIYNLNNPNCNDIDSIVISVKPIPDIIIDKVGILYINSEPITLSAFPLNGEWFGIGIDGNIFNPRIAGVGTYIIRYSTLVDRWGCFNSDTIHINVLMPPTPASFWLPDTTGCNPLTVQFRNLSQNAEFFIWDFGDKLYSNEENPEHIYYIPGEYKVRLTAYNVVGSSFHEGVIKVFQNPIASIEAYPVEIISNNQIVNFTSHSFYAVTYLWNFGDGNSSIEENPWHKYESLGTYKVSLNVTSKDGCVDSVFLKTGITVDWKSGTIKFPNAFRWNQTGPTGGHWQEGFYEGMNYVFRPHFENVIEYKLYIYNRWGELVYESNDLYKGWDGYTERDNLAAQAVYVWLVEGRYADGTYFKKIGDVTFLH